MEDPVSVCLFIPHLAIGGAELQLSLLAHELPKAGFRPLIATLETRDEVAGPLVKAGIPVHVLPRGGAAGLGAIRALARLVGEEKVGIVHAWLFAANWRAALARVLAPRARVLMSIRSMEDDIDRRHEVVYRFVAPLAHAIVVNARAVRDRSSGRTGIPPSKYRVVGNAVDLPRLDREAAEGAPELHDLGADPVAGYIGGLQARKRVRTLPRIAPALLAAVPGVRFLVVGDGAERSAMEQDAARLGVGMRFHFTGYRDRVGRYAARMQVLVHPSMNEGCCNAILEAAALGIPVVAYAVGGNPEIVRDGETGFLVADGDEAALAERATWLLLHTEEARTMGARARRLIREEFSVEAMTRATVAIYREALGRSEPSRTVGRPSGV